MNTKNNKDYSQSSSLLHNRFQCRHALKTAVQQTTKALTCKRSPGKFEKVVVTTAVRLRELVLVNDQIAKQNIKNP